jgi:hypothetical protein
MQETQHKNGFPLIMRARQLFHSHPGERFTAIELNNLLSTGDSRKLISILRRESMNIRSFKFPNGKKQYWFEEQQSSLQAGNDELKKGGPEND